MTIEIGLLISLIGVIISFVVALTNQKRASKAEIEKKAGTDKLIEYQLKELKEDVQKILNKLERYDEDIEKIINEKMDQHLLIYHKKGD